MVRLLVARIKHGARRDDIQPVPLPGVDLNMEHGRITFVGLFFHCERARLAEALEELFFRVAGVNVAIYTWIEAVETKGDEIRALIRVIKDGLRQERKCKQTV